MHFERKTNNLTFGKVGPHRFIYLFITNYGPIIDNVPAQGTDRFEFHNHFSERDMNVTPSSPYTHSKEDKRIQLHLAERPNSNRKMHSRIRSRRPLNRASNADRRQIKRARLGALESRFRSSKTRISVWKSTCPSSRSSSFDGHLLSDVRSFESRWLIGRRRRHPC